MKLLSTWRAELDATDDCPWPGPRPMRDRTLNANALQGRKDDSEKLARLIRGHAVVVLTGASGVGKTSALYMAVRPHLEQSYNVVMLCDTWSPRDDLHTDAAADGSPQALSELIASDDAEVGHDSDEDPEERDRKQLQRDRKAVGDLIASQVERDLPPDIELGPGQPSLVKQLDLYYPGSAVIILDQFEELIRYRPRVYRKVLDWIKHTANTSGVRIVISLRIEYEHELTRELKAGPFTQTRMELLPIVSDELIIKIIDSGRTDTDEAAIAPEAAEDLLAAWRATFDLSGWSEIGLLHLQATLYTLWNRKEGHRIELTDVQKMSDVAAASATSADRGVAREVNVFQHGLASSVQVALDHCWAACENAGVDKPQRRRTRELVVRMTEHLSSGGYKISLDRSELGRRVLGENWGRGVSRDLAHAAAVLDRKVNQAAMVRGHETLQDAYDWLALSRANLFGENHSWHGDWPWELDADDLTGGAMLGLAPAQSALEELRSYHFALEWLRMCELVRVTTTEPGKVMVSLVHDRFANGLDRWKNDQAKTIGMLEAVARVSAIQGALLDWSDDIGSLVAAGAEPPDDAAVKWEPDPTVIANVRWVSCRITRNFKRISFVGSDFRGSTFKGCRFEGVAFVNCLLDDVEFVDCEIIGAPTSLPPDLEERQKRDQPAFHVQVPEDLIKVLNRYRETDVAGTLLFSRTAGVAAVPKANGHNHEHLVPMVANDPPEDEKREHAARVAAGRAEGALPPKGLGLPQSGGLTMFGGRLSSLKFRSCTFHDGGNLSLRHVAGSSVELAEQTAARVEIFAAALRGLTLTQPINELAKIKQKSDRDDDGDEQTETDQTKWFDLRFSDALIINTWLGAGLRGRAEFTNCVVWQVFNASETCEVVLPDSVLLGGVNVDDDSAARREDLEPGTLGDIFWQVNNGSARFDFQRTPAKFELESELRQGEES